MMATWADDEDIVCVHPGGPRLVGYDAVRTAWEQLFAGDAGSRSGSSRSVVIETVGLAMQSAIEHVYSARRQRRAARAVATNVFMRTPSGWRMVCHHASLRRRCSRRRRGRCTDATRRRGARDWITRSDAAGNVPSASSSCGRRLAFASAQPLIASRLAERRHRVPPTVILRSAASAGRRRPARSARPCRRCRRRCRARRSLPIIDTRVSASGPLPISVAPFTG